ncbi:ferrous iron transport protein B [Nocardia sp. CDC160]|uniref:ferrous iron transport protein B n=1 Tax=Nocardia sp. CDC160 TaxID=3112166 RepID=UPI002DBD2A20|nr:ferrous iron transport protein B [Nocardia sp. CDC160]MEC3916395.1 ferrous iron transport protein B [Nocardia sp. CDC160]
MSEACCGTSASGPIATLTGAATVVLVGNPNVGKSTLFNAATGARQRVGNWPGTTVEVTEGPWKLGPDHTIRLLDLPGTHSLLPAAPDEAVTRDALLTDGKDRPDVVVTVIDAANLARSLYLLSQVLETGVPTVVAVTMTDVAKGRGTPVDAGRLAKALGVPVVPLVARGGTGMPALARAVDAALSNRHTPVAPHLGEDVETAFEALKPQLPEDYPARFLALALMAGEPPPGVPVELTAAAHTVLAESTDEPMDSEDDAEILIAERRYAWAHDVRSAVVTDAESHTTLSDRVDRIVTHRWIGVPIFLAVMWLVFELTTTVAKPLQDALGGFFTGPVADAAADFLTALHAPRPLIGLVHDGFINGVGQVLSFVPLMVIMFVLLALLEDSGYMARAAFVADRLMRAVGLPGRAVLPLIVGFGCNVPAIAGTKVLSNPRHRLLTALLIPFTSCNARLVVYVLLAGVFFGSQAGTVVFAMYLTSIVLVVGIGYLLRNSMFRDMADEPLVLDLPPYRRPSLRVLGTHTWQKMRGFLTTASGIIVATVTGIWLLASIPVGGGSFGEVAPDHSALGAVSSAVAPAFAPAGFDDWHAGAALISGFVAKEAVVATISQSYSMDDPGSTDGPGEGAPSASLSDSLRDTFRDSSGGHTIPAVLAFMMFLLAYTPCMTTLAVLRNTIGLRMTLMSVVLQLSVAWVLAVAVFQIGRIFW